MRRRCVGQFGVPIDAGPQGSRSRPDQ
jgi:hypothetical protein